MIRSIEAFLNMGFKVKGKHIFSFFFLICLPYSSLQTFGALFLAIRAFGRDIQDKNTITAMLSLPFKKRDLFFFSWVFGLFTILIATMVSWIFKGFIEPYKIVYLLVFFTFYYGIATYFASTEHSVFAMTFFVFILDAILLSVPGYAYVSVITQGNPFMSIIYSFLALGLGYYGFLYKYES